MNTLKVAEFAKSAQVTLAKHSPEILTGIGIAGMVSTTVLAVRATPKAIRLMHQAENEKNDELTKLEVVKACWKPYIPAAVTGVTSIVCLIGASSVNAKRNAALAAAYTLSDTAFREYKEKVIETIGEKKEQIVKDKVAEEKMKKDPVDKKPVYITGNGNSLCYDTISGRYFESNIDKIKKVENQLNKQMLSEMYISLNDFYDAVGLERLDMGEELGWKLDSGLLELDFNTQLAADGRPCLVIDFNIVPKYDYYKFA